LFLSVEIRETLTDTNTDASHAPKEMNRIIAYIKENPSRDDIFLILLKGEYLPFHREAERESIVV